MCKKYSGKNGIETKKYPYTIPNFGPQMAKSKDHIHEVKHLANPADRRLGAKRAALVRAVFVDFLKNKCKVQYVYRLRTANHDINDINNYSEFKVK